MNTHRHLQRQNIEDILALTPMQQGMLFYYINQPLTELYFEQLSLRILGPTLSEQLRKAWELVAASNEMLRTVFKWDDLERPVQIILKELPLDFREMDLSQTAFAEQEQVLEEIRLKDRQEGLDIRTFPYRVILCKLREETYEMIFSSHHLISDGWSNGIILKELNLFYQSLIAGELPQPMVKPKFKEYLLWLKRQDREGQGVFWRQYLREFRTKTLLPLAQVESNERFILQKSVVQLPASQVEQLTVWARSHEITLATMIYAAWGSLLQQYNRTDDVVFGTTVAGRTPELQGVESMVGLFINTLPFRCKTNPRDTVPTVLKQLEQELRMRVDFEGAALVDIRDAIDFDRQSSLFDSIVVFENYPLDYLTQSVTALKIEAFRIFEMTNYDLTLVVTCQEGLNLTLLYDQRHFTAATIRKILAHLEWILTLISQASEQTLMEQIMISEVDVEWFVTQIAEQRECNEVKVSTEATVLSALPETKVENDVAAIWRKVLGVDRIGTNDNFFDLGGNSISLMLVHTKIDKIYPGVLSGVDLFSYPTVGKLAQYISARTGTGQNQIQVERIEIPEEYLANQFINAEQPLLSLQLKSSLLAGLQAIAMQEAVSFFTILAALYIYLFSEIANVKKVAIQVVSDQSLHIASVAVDLSQIGNFTTLFQTTQHLLGTAVKQRLGEMVITMGSKKRNLIAPLFYQSVHFTPDDQIIRYFGIGFGITEAADRIDLVCHYDPQRFDKEKVKTLINVYGDLLGAVVRKYVEVEIEELSV